MEPATTATATATCAVVTSQGAAVADACCQLATAARAAAETPEKESGFESSPSSPNSTRSVELLISAPKSAIANAPVNDARVCNRTRKLSRVSLNSFKFIKKLGSGGYGQVLLVQKRSGRDRGSLYAMKVMRLSRAALVERDIMPRLQGLTYITHLAYAFYDPARSKAFLVVAYCAGKDLFSLAGPSRSPGYMRRMFSHNYPEYLSRVRIILAELCCAIIGLHQRGILYRDLKLENILVHGDGHIRLADFGLSRCFQPGEPVAISGKTGTPDYMAPEVICSSGTRGPPTKYGYSADIWGLGIVAFELVTGQLPFKGREVSDLEEAILYDPLTVPASYMDKFGALGVQHRPLLLAAFSFINGLLQRDPARRLTAQQIPGHIFFKDLDWTRVVAATHDEPPFDVCRILTENPDYSDADRRVSPFNTSSPSSNNNSCSKAAAAAGASTSNFDNPVKYANYGYEAGRHGWRVSDECKYVGDNSWTALPSGVTGHNCTEYDSAVDCDECAATTAAAAAAASPSSSLSPSSCSSGSCELTQLPGLLQFEIAAASLDRCDAELSACPAAADPAISASTSRPSSASVPGSVQPQQQQQQVAMLSSSRKRTSAALAAAAPAAAAGDSLSSCRHELPPKKRRRFRHNPSSSTTSTATTAATAAAAASEHVTPAIATAAAAAAAAARVCSPLPPFSSLRQTRSARVAAG